MKFRMPGRMHARNGGMRRVGFEIEYAGLELEQAARIIQRLFNGTLQRKNPFSWAVEQSDFGDFHVEVDTAILKDQAYEEYLERMGLDLEEKNMRQSLAEFLLKAASTIVPHEVISPPIPLDSMDRMEELKEELRRQKARGTRKSLVYAFGLHLNPEVPDTEVHTVLGYLRAFLLLQEWIREKSMIDFSRRLTPFINDFPDNYLRLVLDPAYEPGMDRFITDYLIFNPTRNRPLDLLPLLAHIDEDMVMAGAKQQHAINPRPAFHYRLPNCLIDDPDWTLAREWNLWWEVENLSEDSEKMQRMGEEFRELKDTLNPFSNKWADRVSRWME
ncbi:MAG: amidoligase family protein [Desulfovibrionales bacterium]